MKHSSRRRFGCMLLGGGLAFAMRGTGAMAQGQELRIGYVAPTTGIFAQQGKDMVDGFQLYLDEVKSDFGGAKVQFIVEDEQGKPDTARRKSQEADPAGQDPHLRRRPARHDGLRAGSGQHRRQDRLRGADRGGGRSHAARPRQVSPTWSAPAGRARSRAIRSGSGLASRATRRSSPSAPTMPSATRSSAASSARSRPAGARSSRRSGRRSGAQDFGPFIPTIKQDADAIFTLMVGPMSLRFPKQLAASGNKKPVIGGGTSYDEFVLPSMGDEVIGHVSVLQYSAALDTPKNAEFVKRYRAKYGKVPSYYSESNYTTAQMIHKVIADNKRQVPGPGGVRQAACLAQARYDPRPGQHRRDAQPGAEHLHQEGREEEDVRLRQGRALEHRDQDLSERRPVRAVQEGGVPGDAGLQPRLSALQILQVG